MLKNLVSIYTKLDETVKAARLSRFIELLEGCGNPQRSKDPHADDNN